MPIRYLTDAQGHPTDVVIPIEKCEAIRERIATPNPETVAAMEEASNPDALRTYATPAELWEELESEV